MLRMLIFFSVFLTIYSLMHLAVFRGLRPLWQLRPSLALPLGLFMAVMVIAPILARLLERLQVDAAARALALLGYVWMGFLFLTFSTLAALFSLKLLLGALARFFPALSAILPGGTVGPAVALMVAVGLGIYGLIDAERLRVEQVRIETELLPSQVARLTIAQISDVHLGLIHRERALRRVTELLRTLQPDLLVATGDLVDAQIDHLDGLSRHLAELSPPLGKFAVTGNHEFYAGLEQALSFTEGSGFTVLRQQTVAVGPLLLAGVDDLAGGAFDEGALLQGRDRQRYTILLKHRPTVHPLAGELFDLQLSGHSHRGQIFPFNFITGLAYPLQDGLYHLAGGGNLYTSRGTATWGPPMRVFAPPEITLIELVRPSIVR
jgi:predicted MPP superfamily phosphohydrolase